MTQSTPLQTQATDLPESRLRSIVKAFSWRIVATSTTAIIAFIITGEILIALQIGLLEFVFKLAIYYLHERAWQRVPRGTFRRFQLHRKDVRNVKPGSG